LLSPANGAVAGPRRGSHSLLGGNASGCKSADPGAAILSMHRLVSTHTVIAGLDPAIHLSAARTAPVQAWIAGSSPAMTEKRDESKQRPHLTGHNEICRSRCPADPNRRSVWLTKPADSSFFGALPVEINPTLKPDRSI